MHSSKDVPMLPFETDEQIEGGTPGGPIINDSGEIVGIVSNCGFATETQHKSDESAPLPHLACPSG
jgi:hypothetical protein